MAKIRQRKVYILFSSTHELLGVWTNLKYLCNDMGKIELFVSYSKLSKEIAELRKAGEVTELSITTKDEKAYQIKIEILR